MPEHLHAFRIVSTKAELEGNEKRANLWVCLRLPPRLKETAGQSDPLLTHLLINLGD